ncbi:MAG: prolipoprotein diacylglyceryl transferase [Chitinophagales bacterium]|nr:prolipoprotein diacylglyceryl transferase [Chitinophagales bacterium]
MYPTISDLIKDLFGIYIPLPIQSFGFMMAVSFFFAAWTLAMELKRKEKAGLLFPVKKNVIEGAPATILDLILNALGGFIVGYKLVAIVLDYKSFVGDPQSFLLSTRGNLLGGAALGIILLYLKYREKEKQRLPQPEKRQIEIYPHQLVGDITIVAAVSGLLGAKIFDNLEHIDSFIADPITSLLSFSGLTFYGGLIFGAIAVLYFARKNKISVLHLADAAAPGLILAYGIGRIGCQLAGDGDWGIVNFNPKPSWFFFPHWAWAYNYPHNVIQEGIAIPDCVGKFCYQLAHPVYPTPLYETTAALLIFFFLWSIRKKIRVPGMIFSIYLLLNGIERFLVELIRVNVQYHFMGINATQAEIIGVVMVVLGITGILFFQKRYALKQLK